MSEELFVERVDEVWEGELLRREVSGVALVLIRVGNDVLVYDDRCPHLGAALSDGYLCQRKLTCAVHQWEYDVASGDGINPKSAQLTRVRARVSEGGIWVSASDVEALGRKPGKKLGKKRT